VRERGKKGGKGRGRKGDDEPFRRCPMVEGKDTGRENEDTMSQLGVDQREWRGDDTDVILPGNERESDAGRSARRKDRLRKRHFPDR